MDGWMDLFKYRHIQTQNENHKSSTQVILYSVDFVTNEQKPVCQLPVFHDKDLT